MVFPWNEGRGSHWSWILCGVFYFGNRSSESGDEPVPVGIYVSSYAGQRGTICGDTGPGIWGGLCGDDCN